MKFFKSKWFRLLVIITVVIGVASVFNLKKDVATNYRTVTVNSGDIDSFVEGSSSVKSSEARNVYSKVSSEILEVLHEEGDLVMSGDVIAILDSKNFTSTVDAQKIALEQAKLSYNNIKKQINNLTIVANSSGYVNGLTISEGSYVSNTMQICNITESGAFEITLPFNYSEANNVQVGASAKVTLIQNFSTLDGTVTKVSEMRKLGTGNSQVIDVTIKVLTPGYSLAGSVAKAEAIVNGTRQASTSTGTFVTVNSNIVRAKSTGTVQTLNVYEGKFVSAGDVIAVLINDDLQTSLDNANLTIKNLNSQLNIVNDQLDNYTIKAPISGTITAQTIDVGDMVAAGTVLTTISDKNLLEITIPVDELDIAKLNYEQDVEIIVDALEETEVTPIRGKISKLPLEGISTAGVTEYYVTIQFPGREDIRISMNATAKIITSSKKDVLVIPIDAVEKENGVSYVEVLLEDNTTEKREVEVGDRNISYVEVKSGLNQGEKVIIPEASSIFGMHMTGGN